MAASGDLRLVALGVEGEVDHHDRVLLDDADEQHDADERHDAEVLAGDHQRRERADASRRQGRQDRQWVDVALVQDAEHDVDGDDRREDQRALVGQRCLEGACRSLEFGADGLGQTNLASGRLDRAHRFAKRRAGSEVERQGDGGKLRLMIEDQRRARRRPIGNGSKRDVAARPNVDTGERVGTASILGRELEDDVVLIELREDGRHLPLAERRIERVVHRLSCDSHARRGVAIDRHVGPPAAALLIRRDVTQDWRALQPARATGLPSDRPPPDRDARG